MNKSPCKDCNDRHVGCHGSCEEYLAFDRERKALNEDRYNAQREIYDNEIYRKRKKRTQQIRMDRRRRGLKW